MTDDNNPPAFPVVTPDGVPNSGMSLRDWFAGQALAGIMSQAGASGDWTPAEVAADAYAYASAMLAARKTGGAA